MPTDGETREEKQHTARAIPVSVVCLVAATAVAAVALLVTSWVHHEVSDPVGLAAAALAGLICGARRVRASRAATISVGYVIVIGALVNLGPPEACVAAALSGLAILLFPSEKHRQPPVVTVYAIASLVVTAWVAGQVYVLIGGRAGAIDVSGLGIPTLCAAATYHTVNCLLVAAVSGLASGRSTWWLFRTNFSSVALTYYAGAGLALLVHMAWQLGGDWTILAALPVLYTLHLALSRYARDTETAENAA